MTVYVALGHREGDVSVCLAVYENRADAEEFKAFLEESDPWWDIVEVLERKMLQ